MMTVEMHELEMNRFIAVCDSRYGDDQSCQIP